MNKILSLWAVPRSTSTAFEKMMSERGDYNCLHEPFGEAWYLGEDRRVPRPNDTPPRPGLTFDSVWRDLQRLARDGPVFSKDFPHYIMHLCDDAFLDQFEHTFLIRDPEKVLPSMYKHWPDFIVEETGFAEQRALFDRLCDKLGRVPPVVDSDDLLADPHGIVQAYCNACDIPYIAEALEWGEGDRKQYSWYDSGSWHGNLEQSTGLKPQKRDYVAIDHDPRIFEIYQQCLPHYEAMKRHKILLNTV
jgi:hypothetical protein